MLTNSPFNPLSPSFTFTFTDPPPRSPAPFLSGFLPPPPPPFPSLPFSPLFSLPLSLPTFPVPTPLLPPQPPPFLLPPLPPLIPKTHPPPPLRPLLPPLHSPLCSLPPPPLLPFPFFPFLQSPHLRPLEPQSPLLISALSRLNCLVEAFSLFNSLSDFNLCPDAATYHSLMLGLSHKSQVATALQLFDEMLNKVATPLRYLPHQPLLPFPFSPFFQSPHLRPLAPQSPGRSLLPLQFSLRLQPFPRRCHLPLPDAD